MLFQWILIQTLRKSSSIQWFQMGLYQISRLNSGIRNRFIFYVGDFFISKNWKWFSESYWFWGYPSLCPILWELDFENFYEFLKMRGWCLFAWAFSGENSRKCWAWYFQQVELIKPTSFFDFRSTHEIFTPVKSIFWVVFSDYHR